MTDRRHRCIKYILQVTQLVSGKAGFELRQSDPRVCVLYHYIPAHCGLGTVGFMPIFQMGKLWFREPKS